MRPYGIGTNGTSAYWVEQAKLATMEANENIIPQTGRVEDEYVRIGTTLFRILNQPMMNGSFRKMRVEWKMSVFRTT